ncbi:response regulator transcription factor [Simplicispira psychrophila]|uniref:response regulator transcription factor n=1 Tax=Simplicispira psychrophila TaxID=80882 RepID=UPI000480BDDF|nr:response regulator transcription factor [Simplicispira psychrophila]
MATLLNIVVVEDHDALREVTVHALASLGHAVVGIDCAERFDDSIGARPVDLLVIDLNLPGEDGISLARRIRAAQPQVGIIMVTARGQINDKVMGYENGADLYLTKPTSLEELGAAVQALARRLKRQHQQLPDCWLNLVSFVLQGPQGSVNLTAYEAAMLSGFTRAPGGRLESWQLLEMAGKQGANASKSTLEVQIVRLRRKLVQVACCEHPLKAIRGWGYQLCLTVAIS